MGKVSSLGRFGVKFKGMVYRLSGTESFSNQYCDLYINFQVFYLIILGFMIYINNCRFLSLVAKFGFEVLALIFWQFLNVAMTRLCCSTSMESSFLEEEP